MVTSKLSRASRGATLRSNDCRVVGKVVKYDKRTGLGPGGCEVGQLGAQLTVDEIVATAELQHHDRRWNSDCRSVSTRSIPSRRLRVARFF